MKSLLLLLLSFVLASHAFVAVLPPAFLSTAPSSSLSGRGVLVSSTAVSRSTSTTQLFIFGGPKDDGSPGDYVCKDCGYVFTKGPKAWAALPADYSCPPCGAPKYRFKKVPKGSASGKVEVKKSWFGK